MFKADGVQALIFDLGKVVFDFSFEETLAGWASAAGLGIEMIKERFTWDVTYEAYERGELDLHHFHMWVAEQLGRDIPRKSFEAAWLSMFRDEIPGVKDLLKRLQNHYRLVALSNTNADHARIWRQRYSKTLSVFEKIFVSHEIGARKPETRAFGLVLDYLDLKAKETVFVDDMPENVTAAGRLGLGTILFQHATQLEEDLFRLGILPVSGENNNGDHHELCFTPVDYV